MFKILAETHKLIAEELYNIILDRYEIKLNLKQMKWGSVAPDVLPYYKFKRHYLEESVKWLSREITSLIFFSRYCDFNSDEKSFYIKYLSRKIGIISHYLSDYTCYPHAVRMTFATNMKEHIRYESDLNMYAKNHRFEDKPVELEIPDLYSETYIKLDLKIENYIRNYMENYLKDEKSFENDMNYAITLNKNINLFVFDTILNYTEELEYQFI